MLERLKNYTDFLKEDVVRRKYQFVFAATGFLVDTASTFLMLRLLEGYSEANSFPRAIIETFPDMLAFPILFLYPLVFLLIGYFFSARHRNITTGFIVGVGLTKLLIGISNLLLIWDINFFGSEILVKIMMVFVLVGGFLDLCKIVSDNYL